jgi:hypothetical protein
LSRAKRALSVTLTSALLLGALSAPALAINDSFVPANECSDNPKSVGEPTGVPGQNPGINTADPVAAPVSDANPGQGSTGAKGEENSQAAC